METVKVSMNLPVEDNLVIGEIAQKRHLTKTDVVRRGVALEKLIDELAPDGELVIQHKDGSLERIRMTW